MRIFTVRLTQVAIITLISGLFFAFSTNAWAQFDETTSDEIVSDNPESETGGVEELYDQFDKEQTQRQQQQQTQEKKKEKSIGTLTDLATLAPFEDVAVIQRRFLPKTGRFEVSPSGMITLNNPFFSNLGLGLRGAYYFLEKHGLELQYFFLSNSAREVTTNLEKKRGVRTSSLTVPQQYMGIAYKWNPVYGKMTLLNKAIVPFDLYFTLGGGLTKTDESSGEGTVHLGTGQAFALSKKVALRWDLTWNFYSAQATDVTGRKISNSQDDLFISVGMNFYFPEAKYR